VILGAHVRRRRSGIEGAIGEAVERGADCLQIFVSNPRSWAGPRYDDTESRRFRETLAASGLRPCVAHLSYVGNVASWDPTTLRRTRQLLVETVRACDALGVDLLVVHTGAGGPQDREAALRAAAESYRRGVRESVAVGVLAELMAGTTGAVASFPAEAEELPRRGRRRSPGARARHRAPLRRGRSDRRAGGRAEALGGAARARARFATGPRPRQRLRLRARRAPRPTHRHR
jgi:endonuclease IV